MKSSSIIYIIWVSAALIWLTFQIPKIMIPACSLIALASATVYMSNRNKRQEYRKIFESVFKDAENIPLYKQEWLYGYPYFQLTFENQTELDQYLASNKSSMFSARIEEICKTTGIKKEPFDVKKAISLIHKDQIKLWEKEGQELRQSLNKKRT